MAVMRIYDFYIIAEKEGFLSAYVLYNSVSVFLQKEALNTGLNRLQIMLFWEIYSVLDD